MLAWLKMTHPFWGCSTRKYPDMHLYSFTIAFTQSVNFLIYVNVQTYVPMTASCRQYISKGNLKVVVFAFVLDFFFFTNVCVDLLPLLTFNFEET